jgi:hypothetical protein
MFGKPRNDSVKRWLYGEQLASKGSAAFNLLDLSGGKFFVPQARQTDFLRVAAAAAYNREPYFLCEVPPAFFRFYVDLDYAGITVLLDDDIQAISCHIQRAVWTCYPEMDDIDWKEYGLAYVTVCKEATPANVPGRTFVKTGVHIIFANLFVDRDRANLLGQYMLQYLMAYVPQHDQMVAWSKVIDLGVYSPGGLRMLGASKCSPCSTCHRKPALINTCQKCGAWGSEIQGQGRCYSPLFVLEGTRLAANSSNFYTDLTYAVPMTSLLVFSGSGDAHPGFKLPESFVPMDIKKIRAIGRPLVNEMPFGDRRTMVLQRIIQSLRPEWKDLIVIKTTIGNPHKRETIYYKISIHGEGKTFCANVRRAHRTSDVYFMVSRLGIGQYCFSKRPADTGCPNCLEYGAKTPRTVLSPEAYIALFSQHSTNGQDIQDDLTKAFGGSSSIGGSSQNEYIEGLMRRSIALKRLNVAVPGPIDRAGAPLVVRQPGAIARNYEEMYMDCTALDIAAGNTSPRGPAPRPTSCSSSRMSETSTDDDMFKRARSPALSDAHDYSVKRSCHSDYEFSD